jgi:hypothetical protein
VYAGIQLTTFVAEIESLTDRAGFDGAGTAESCGFLAFASKALLILFHLTCFGGQQGWTGAAKDTAITIQYIFHFFSFIMQLLNSY